MCENIAPYHLYGRRIGEIGLKLFYSYCHIDETFRKEIAKSLAPLRSSARIDEWHDRRIIAGASIHAEIDKHLRDSDIILLLLSPDYLDSEECMAEMRTAMYLRSHNGTFVIPILVRPCVWKDYNIRDLRAVPTDALPVVEWASRDRAYLDIYENLKHLVETMPFRPTTDYLTSLTEVEFISQNKDDIKLDDIFIFPTIESSHDQNPIQDLVGIWKRKTHVIIHGDDKVGKTVLCRKLVLSESLSDRPVMLLSGAELTSTRNHEAIIIRKFQENFRGSYEYWKSQPNKLLIIDDVSRDTRTQFLDYAKKYFERILVVLPTDDYLAYFKSDESFAEFDLLTFSPLGQEKQEQLIRNWLNLNNNHGRSAQITDGSVDQIEDVLNTIIIHNNVVPRYPFYVLSILQTLEAFMPQGLHITAYGHCYQALITAQLLRMRISPGDIDTALNFLRHFAFRTYRESRRCSHESFAAFLKEYQHNFEIKESIWRRLSSDTSLILKQSPAGYEFRYPFVYFFFVGHYFAQFADEHKEIVERMADNSYVRENAHILTFIIHHAQDTDLIDTILLHTAFSLGDAGVATLENSEVKYVEQALNTIPRTIISTRSVSEERSRQRQLRDKSDIEPTEEEDSDVSLSKKQNEFYRLLKNMEILGQVLRNRHGSMPREKLAEIVVFVTEAGLRAVSMFHHDIVDMARLCAKTLVDDEIPADVRSKIEELREQLPKLAFFVVQLLLRKIVAAIRKPEISRIVSEVVRRQPTPAYEILHALFELTTTNEVDSDLVTALDQLHARLDKAHNAVALRILSLEMQGYLNTHRIEYRQRQRMFRLLGLKYRPNRG